MARGRLFRDRRDAGRQLAGQLHDEYAGRPDVVVMALLRGGVPVAFEIARSLGAPLEPLVVRKIGFPGHPELAMGAVGPEGVTVLNDRLLRRYAVPRGSVAEAAERALTELNARKRELNLRELSVQLAGRTAIVVDDGMATGMSMRAAVLALRRRGVASVAVAVPVAAPEAFELLAGEVDLIVCGRAPEPFEAVGAWYADFDQLSDEDVRALIEQAAGSRVEAKRASPEGPAR
jgi:putative phosphoribosyl transferase